MWSCLTFYVWVGRHGFRFSCLCHECSLPLYSLPRFCLLTLWGEVEGRMGLDMTICSYIEVILQYSLRHSTLYFYKTTLGICMFWLFICLCTMSVTDSRGSQERLSLEFSYRLLGVARWVSGIELRASRRDDSSLQPLTWHLKSVASHVAIV